MRIKSLSIKNNPILGDIDLDFTDTYGNIVDTVIFAGENGCGKTTLLNCLSVFDDTKSLAIDEERRFILELDQESNTHLRKWYRKSKQDWEKLKSADYTLKRTESHTFDIKYFYDEKMQLSSALPISYPLNPSCIYLTPEISFNSEKIGTITTKTTDEHKEGLQKTPQNIATQITQLIIDIDTQDNSDFTILYNNTPRADYTKGDTKKRISRFNNGFKEIFNDILIDGVVNENEQKIVKFKNKGKSVSINQLSSGEKQIVFRGGQLLKDKNILNDALVLIDEPEISMHPNWQKKILDFYKKILTNEEGIQTSQLFVATHSPFIIHNDNRKNDKVFVFAKEEDGKVKKLDNPEYYDCNSPKVIEDAFNTHEFSNIDSPIVYVEGKTDEMYFNRAVEVFEYKNLPFQFKWVGYIDTTGQERNTGNSALCQAYDFLVAHNNGLKNVCLFDSDTNKQKTDCNQTFCRTVTKDNFNKWGMKKGIENAINFGGIDMDSYFSSKSKEGDYGKPTIIPEFAKMKCCKGLCAMSNEELKITFANLKIEIDKLIEIFK